jgi:hypothetical protein
MASCAARKSVGRDRNIGLLAYKETRQNALRTCVTGSDRPLQVCNMQARKLVGALLPPTHFYLSHYLPVLMAPEARAVSIPMEEQRKQLR